jgi:hypothetical protein
MDGDSKSTDPPWGFILALGGLVIVAIALLLLPGLLSPKPAPTPAPSPTLLDPHVVVTPNGTLVFAFEDGAIVVRRTVDAVTTELGRAALPGPMLPAATDAPVNGSASFLMVCPAPGGGAQDRFVFGHLDGSPITYTGPTADGQGAPDGFFLFALRPGEISDALQIRIEVVGHGMVGAPGSEFRFAASDGVLQPSGCRVSG